MAGPTTIGRPDADGEGELLAALAKDLDAGFVALMQAHQGAVYSLAFSVTDGAADAEDLAAEAFLRAYRGLCGFDGERMAALKLRPWLFTIVLNTWRNRLRTAGRRPLEVPLDGVVEPRHPGTGVAELAERADSQRRLLELVRGLPERQRTAVVLRHVVGLPTSEVAAILGCPQGTAKSHISRGLQRLRVLYDRREP